MEKRGGEEEEEEEEEKEAAAEHDEVCVRERVCVVWGLVCEGVR